MKYIHIILIDFLFLALAMLFFMFFLYLSGKVPEAIMMYVVYGGFCLSFYLSHLLRKRFKS